MTEKPVCLNDFEEHAKRILPKAVYDYYRSGADAQQTLADNVAAFSRWRLYPRVLRDVSQIDLSVSVLGQRISMPVCVAATAMQRMAHPDGETATVRACQSAGTGMMISSWATSSIEEVAESAPDSLRWLQLYIYKDRELTKSLVLRAEKAGYKGIFVTVDTPYLGKRQNDVRNRFMLPSHLRMANFKSPDMSFSSKNGYGEDSGLAVYVAQAIDPTLKWEDIAWLKKLTKLPIVVKGILRADDAQEAVKYGVDGILVSNHGARQLDCVPATIDVLSEIVEAVEGRAEVFLDGGVRKGTDVIKALALGAKAVFVGRPVLWGLAYQGENGVNEVLQLLRQELILAVALTGCRTVNEIDKSIVRKFPSFASRI
ncbi:hydroxyacid oxidase 1 [Polyodon spathula]|uniref:hydroxyacid oxidase 1 n=1 Tax=Polyodon spathula TaxID=7913 RepID=UPI001B7F74AC|nr:hydroxyacid oxidase 1 [Polyodon spathula]